MKRRTFIRQSAAAIGLFGAGGSALTLLEATLRPQLLRAASFQKISLPIPPLFDAAVNDGTVGLEVKTGRRMFWPDIVTETLGYNGEFLGPTIRVRTGERVRMQVRNSLKESTTVHWHGLHVPAEWDGGPRQVIEAGAEWHPEFTIKQEAATLWYHPHALGRTGEHVYRGLAGLFFVEDDFSEQCPIPADYGVDDIPLVIQDRRFYQDGRFAYVTSGHDIMRGIVGNYLLVNGTLEPHLSVQRGIIRFRLLNGSNASLYRLSWSDGRKFHVIAGDGGFLEQPEPVDALVFAPGERYEILVDFSGDPVGNSSTMVVEQWGGNRFPALQVSVSKEAARYSRMPQKLRPLDRIAAAEASQTRQFAMETFSAGGGLTINGKHMDLARIDATVRLGNTEIWEITNDSGMMMRLPHSMHLHDVQFQIIERNGALPPPVQRGRKDTVLVMPGERVRIISRFEDYTGIYMFHCHMLEHEDSGMMGQFEVVS